MTTRHVFRLTAATSLMALAGFAAQAIEATQWEPQTETTNSTASNEATLAPTAWTVGRGDATQFHDAKAPDTMTTRSTVREELRLARQHGLLNDTGEGGATDRVLAQREAFNKVEHDVWMALNTPSEPSADPIADIAAMVGSVTVAER
jgi:hypothetical protein